MGKSKKPKISSITRKDYKFSVSWKRGEKYSDKQDADYAIITNKETLFNKAAKAAKKDKKVSGVKYHNISGVGKNDTKASFKINADNYYPAAANFPRIEGIEVRVAGKSKKESMSSYDYKTFDIDKPPKPKLSISVDSGSSANLAHIEITVPSDSDHKPVVDVYYQYVIVNDYDGNPLNKNYWNDTTYNVVAGTKTKSASIPVTVDFDANKTLICRAVTEGWAGDSDEVNAVHQFVEPFKATDLKLYGDNPISIDRAAGYTRVSVSWTAPSGSYKNKTAVKYQANPIDQTTLQYYIGTPEITERYYITHIYNKEYDYYSYDDEDDRYVYIENPDYQNVISGMYYRHEFVYGIPSDTSSSFVDGQNQTDTSGEDFGIVVIPQIVGVDQCLWVRVVTKHDTYVIPSNPLFVYKGELQIPTINSITRDNSNPPTYKARVQVTNNSAVSGSFVALVYNDNTGSSDTGKIIGVIPSGETAADIQCPNWTNKQPISFGAFAVYGSISVRDTKETPVLSGYAKTADVAVNPDKTYYVYNSGTDEYIVVTNPKTEDIDDYYEATYLDDPMIEYAFYEAMRSDITYKGGNTPVSPTGISLKSRLDDTSIPEGTIQVAWDVPWLEATGAEISWADHEDAWYSTNGPSTYEMPLINQPKLNISGLETGKKWYIRIRLYKELSDNNDNKLYSLYSKTMVKDLSMAPDIPVLAITPSGVITPNTDIVGTWVYISNDGTYQGYAEIDEIIDNEYHKICECTTEQYMSFKPVDVGWEAGSEHELVLIVKSQSGQYSKESDKVTVSIAAPLDLQITSTSLVEENMEINPRTYTGNPIIIDNEDELLEVTDLSVEIEPEQDGTPWQDATLETAPYLYRAAPDRNHSYNSEYDELIGGTVVWNQLIQNGNFVDATSWAAQNNSYGSIAVANNELTYTILQVSNNAYSNTVKKSAAYIQGHKYFVRQKINVPRDSRVNISYLSSPIVQNLSAGWHTIETVASPTLSEQYVYFGLNNAASYDYEINDTFTLKEVNMYDLTQMFGSAIADYIYSLEQANAGAGVAWFKKLFPKDYYPYNAGELMSVKTSAHQMVGFNAYNPTTGTARLVGGIQYQITGTYTALSLNGATITPDASGYFTPSANGILTVTGGNSTDTCIHIVWDGERDGDYEAYKKWTYPLDSDLELRGIPKLDSANNLYYDGDTYEDDGTVNRRFGIVDLGTLTYAYYSEEGKAHRFMSTNLSNAPTAVSYNLVCAKPYKPYITPVTSVTDDKCIISYNKQVWITDNDYSSAADFKAAMSGVYLVYELATPTTEEADPYQNPQIVDDFGTEEYVDERTVAIPVGHSTRYADIYEIIGKDGITVRQEGKNKLQNIATSQTVNGITFTVNEDGSVTANGTSTSEAVLVLNTSTFSLGAGTYTASGASGGSNSTYYLQFRVDGVWKNAITSNTFTANSGINGALIDIKSGVTLNNYTFYPQIELGSTATDYEPYNEPIEHSIDFSSYNIWDEEWEQYNTYIRTKNYIPVLPETSYYFKAPAGFSNGVWWYDENKQLIDTQYYVGNRAYTSPSGAKYLKFAMASAYGTTYNHDISINYPSFETNYHSHDEPMSIYGGAIDVTSGDSKVKMVFASSPFTIISLGGTSVQGVYRAKIRANGIKNSDVSTVGNIKCNILPSLTAVQTYQTQEGISCGDTADMFYINVTGVDTIADYQQWIEDSGMEVCYELATPIDLETEPNDVTLFSGYNRISDDCEMTLRTVQYSDDVLALKELPLIVTTTGAGGSGKSMITVKRYADFTTPRPDNEDYIGYDGDIVCSVAIDGDATQEKPLSISLDDLNRLGVQFDDGALYQLITTISDDRDDNGQTATTNLIPAGSNMYSYFVVDWNHQAISPEEFQTKCSVNIDTEYGVAMINIGVSDSEYVQEGDHVDIYRLSADKPELIYPGASFDHTYVDPYPTIGKRGGYRLVYVTNNGDFIDDDNFPAWIDIYAHIDSYFPLIDFGNGEFEYLFNVDTDWSWQKPFTLTHYLGGGLEGDWTAGVEHSGNLKGNIIDDYLPETYDQIRELARHNNMCHVRTLEGSNMVANIQISDNNTYRDPAHLHSISFNITRIDNPVYDGVPIEEWEEAE